MRLVIIDDATEEKEVESEEQESRNKPESCQNH